MRASKGLTALGCIQSFFHRFPKIDSKVIWKVFDTKIKPIVHYGAEIWGFMEAKEIEKVQNKMCKQLLRIHSKVPTIALQGETGRLPLKTNRLFMVINYWLRLISLNNNRLTKDAYNLQVRWVELNKNAGYLK